MARRKAVDDMTAEELFALAKERERQELEQEKEANRALVEELKARKKEITAQYKKDIAAVDTEIRSLGGRTRSRGRSRVNLTDKVVEIIYNAGEISTQDIRAALSEQGLEASNLSQTLAYLKRTGRVASPSRAMYTLA